MKKMKNLLVNTKNQAALKAVLGSITFASMVMGIVGCDKPADCNYDLNQYNTYKDKAASDSTTFVNYKEEPPQQFLDIVDAYIRIEHQPYEQAWESALNAALTNPNASAEAKSWAEQYKVYLNAFNKSVENRQGAYKSWQECEEQK